MGRKADGEIKITNTNLSKLTKELPPANKPKFYWDEELKGFGVKATSKGLTYVVQARVGGGDGKTVRYVIGKVAEKDAGQARDEARKKLAQMRDGEDLNQSKRDERKARKVKGLTFKQAYDELRELKINAPKKNWRPRTVQTYNENINRTLKSWFDLPVASITPEMVLKKHKEISSAGREIIAPDGTKKNRGIASANQAMRIVRRVCNYVMATKTDNKGQSLIKKNPVAILNKNDGGEDSWNDLEARDREVHPDDLAKWYEAVIGLESTKLRDFFVFLVFSGLRRNEAMRLQGKHFDIKTQTLTIPAEISKNKKTRKIPLTDVLLEIYARRGAIGEAYIFPGRHGAEHLKEPKRGVYEVKDKSCINWSSHDLRRSYVTTANRLDVSAYKVKFLVGHSVSGDVTGKHYSKLTVDDVRDAAQEIADFLKEKMGMQTSKIEAVG